MIPTTKAGVYRIILPLRALYTPSATPAKAAKPNSNPTMKMSKLPIANANVIFCCLAIFTVGIAETFGAY